MTVSPGTTLTITPNPGCPLQGGYVVDLASNSVHNAPSAGGPTDADGNWVASVVLTRSVPIGRYTVEASCLIDGHQESAFYQPILLTVQ
jgi:hypothetical protein